MSSVRLNILFTLFLSLLVGCVGEHQTDVDLNDPVELTVSLEPIPQPVDGMSESELLVDGSALSTVSVYVLNADKNIVARQEAIDVTNFANEITVTFDRSYNLKRGLYTILAVANNQSEFINSQTYQSGLVNSWSSTNYDNLMNNKIQGNSTHNISPSNVIQPLSMMKEVELHAGNNVISGELVRTFARLRIEVKNNSGILPLKVKNLSFSNNFTQKQAYVFDDGTDRKYFGTSGAPVATSEYALQPFTTDAGGSAKTIELQSSAVVFDSYLLESKLSAGDYYKYTLDLAYEGVSITTYAYNPEWDSAITQRNNLNVGEESYFLIYNSNRSRYLSSSSSKVGVASLSSNSSTVATDHVWQLISTGAANQYYIKNVESGLYIQAPTNSQVALGANPVAFTFEDKTSGTSRYITLKYSNTSYISMGGSPNYNVTNSTRNNSSSTYFRFYKVNKTATTSSSSSEITYNTPIILTTIDPITQQAAPATAIKRNDFINVLVTVSYNPEAGTFEFHVEDWRTGGGTVEFD